MAVPFDKGRMLLENARKWPNMIVPSITNSGSWMYFSQCDGHNFGLVELQKFKGFGPAAEPSMWLQLFDDFENSKNISLILIHFKTQELSRESSLSLTEALIRLYCSSKSDWPRRFNENPSNFDFNEFVEDFKV